MEEHGALGIADGRGLLSSYEVEEALPSVPLSSQVAGQVSTSWRKPAAALGQQQAPAELCHVRKGQGSVAFKAHVLG